MTRKRKRGRYDTGAQGWYRARRRRRGSGVSVAPTKVYNVPPELRGYARIAGYYGGLEKKFIDVATNDTTVASAGAILNSGTQVVISQGTSQSQRIGRKVCLKNINWRYNINLPSAALMTSTSDMCRVILYWDKQANGATAAGADILTSVNVYGYNNLSNMNRFIILYDKVHSINATAAVYNGAAIETGSRDQWYSVYKKVDIPIEYSGTDGTIDEIQSNNIGVLLVSEAGLCGFESVMRIRYTDE